MRMFIASALLFVFIAGVVAAPPVVSDDRLIIELVAKEPEIVTPTGLAVDERGRVWVIENHTHERPSNYKGPASDRIRVFSEPSEDGHLGKATTFAEGFKNAMSLALGRDGSVYLATRSDIWQLHDTKGAGAADQRKVIVKLDSPGNYPHNGLSGFAFNAAGDLFFSLGENLGAQYKLIGSDGTTLTGGGEGGSIYRCRPDGTKLERVATGFWNTFHLTFDAFGRLFAVDNDPDARGPCRLLHIVQGGDYGYRFRNGRKGLHPFTAWNGELPGTLPMVAGTAEAPCGIVAYESTGLPADYRGKLLVTSWGDHVVEQFTLSPRGASFSATSSVLVRGDEDFRPVAIFTALDGSLYLSDWANKSYPVHGHGRIWRIRMKDKPNDDGLRPSKLAVLDVEKLSHLLNDPRGEIRRAAAETLAGKRQIGEEALASALKGSNDPRARINALWGLARLGPDAAEKLLGAANDKAPEIRGEAAQIFGRIIPKQSSSVLKTMALKDPVAYVRMQALLQFGTGDVLSDLVPILGDSDPFLAAAALDVLGRPGNTQPLLSAFESKDVHLRLGIVVAMRRALGTKGGDFVAKALADPDADVRRAAVQWVGEERLTQFKDQIAAAAAKEPVTRQLFEALLAADSMLSGIKESGETSGEEYVARIVKDAKQPAIFRTFGLRMLKPDHPVFTAALSKELLGSPERLLRHEAVRTLALRSDDASQQLLRVLAADAKEEMGMRAFAVLGLAQSAAKSADTRRQLLALLADAGLQRDVLRSLRDVPLSAEERPALFNWWAKLPAETNGPSNERRELADQLLRTLGPNVQKSEEGLRKQLAELVEPLPADEAVWRKALSGHGDAAAGERVFYHLHGARCAVCHRVDGRGGQVGPELSAIAASHDRAKLIESILSPSKEIAPAFTTWIISMHDGKTHTGVIVGEGFDSTITLADADGKRTILKRFEIEERRASPKSLMPDDLPRQMTRRELLDLLEFLGTNRRP
jgi:putative membrane-bound dehydrogenase-like protein